MWKIGKKCKIFLTLGRNYSNVTRYSLIESLYQCSIMLMK